VLDMIRNAGGPVPSGPADRLFYLDVLRGFALLGVLLSNIQCWFRAPRGTLNLSYSAFSGVWNDVASWLLRAVVESKFIFLFSILFGVGLAIQLGRFEQAGARFWGFATRRLAVLLVIGLVHATLLWNGEILVPYAVIGFLVLPFLHRRPRTLYAWVIGVWALILVLMLAGRVKVMLGQPFPVPTAQDILEMDQDELRSIDRLASHYLSTSWLEVTRFRIVDYARVLQDSVSSMFVLFANMLTGIALWRSGMLRNPAAHRRGLLRFARWAVPAGFLLHAIYASKVAIRVWGYGQPWVVRSALPAVVDLAMIVGAVVFSLGIGAAVLLVATDERWQQRLSPLAAMGRTALSTYLVQSAVMTAVFYGWGLGYYNRMGPAAGAVLGLAFYAAQLGLSSAWVRHFRFGPAEWLWRSATYLVRQPFVAKAQQTAATAE
jgi:uncharacterized protein